MVDGVAVKNIGRICESQITEGFSLGESPGVTILIWLR